MKWGSLISVSLLFHILISISLSNSQICYDTGNFTANGTYVKNRDLVLSSLASNVTANGGFYTTTVGEDTDKVYILALCIADPPPESCSYCVKSAIQGLVTACPNQKEAISWGGDPVPCIIHYANRSIFGILELSPPDSGFSSANIRPDALQQFDQIWGSLTKDVVRRASMGSSNNSKLKFATGVAELNATSDRIYALMQCVPDISLSNCSYCLQQSVSEFNSCCHGSQGGYVQRPSCFFRWDLFPFYNAFDYALAPSLPSPPASITFQSNKTSKRERGISTSLTVTILVPTSIFMALVILACIIVHRTKVEKVNEFEENNSIECMQFKFGTIRLATNKFSDENKLGQGGFGVVYKGKLPNGQDIAVKRLSRQSGQGEVEFKNEVFYVAKLQHRNLVRLLGFCLEGQERLLIYEFVPNSSLDRFIFDPIKRSMLDWETRVQIIVGIAQGILYLHQDSQLRIIHRDLKASNILLDEEMKPKISDFGMAKVFNIDQTQDITSKIVGTFGYMAPEYAMHGRFSEKSDIFSFGVLVLELMTGRKNSSPNNEGEHDYLLTTAWDNWNAGTPSNVIDPVLLRVASRSDVLIRCIHIGLLCVQESVANRPTMASVTLMLNNDSIVLPIPSRPAYFMRSSSVEPQTASRMQHNSSSMADEWASTSRESNAELPPSVQSRNGSAQFSANETSITELTAR